MAFSAKQTIRPACSKGVLYSCVAVACFALIILILHHAGGSELRTGTLTRSAQWAATSSSKWPWLPPLRARDQLANLLQAEDKKVGAELGVQRGHFSANLLSVWKSCQTMYLVDIWRAQTNYKDIANVDNAQQEGIFAEAKQNHKVHGSKSVFIRNTTLEAADVIKEPLDFVYVDARHDYCGVTADVAAYWPKLKSGGIMAGHDYLTSPEVKAIDIGQDWSLCMDGSTQESAVRGAVEEFFRPKGIPVLVTYADGPWVSWFVRKP